MRKFIQKYRESCVLAALFLLISLLVAVRYHFDNEPGSSKIDNTTSQPGTNTPSTGIVQTGIVQTGIAETGIVRKGIVGTPVLVPISTGFSGQISEMYVKEGQTVKAGQPLFKLEGAPVSAETSPDLKVNSNTVESNRYQQLYDIGIISRRELEKAQTRLQSITKSSNNGQSAAPAIANAPIEGIVTGLAAASGSAVQAGQLILSLGSGQTVEVVVSLEQKELYWVQPGTQAVIEVAGHTFKGEVSSIFPEVKENAIASFLAHINLTDPPAGLVQVGMSANVLLAW